MTGPDYSDDEIHRLLREVLGKEKPAPTPTIPKRRTMSRADVSRELSIDEILKKIERGIAGGQKYAGARKFSRQPRRRGQAQVRKSDSESLKILTVRTRR